MKSQLQVTLLLSATLVLPLVAAQQQTPAQPAPSTQKTQLPKSQLPELNRQTQATDQVPVFNFDQYFTGKWNFTWDVPEGPLGPAGTITGTTVFKPVEGKFFLATSEGTGPAGPIKFTELYGYQADQKSLTRYVTDARGFQFLQVGTVGGDLGGYFNIYFDGAPFTVNGKSVRMKHAVRLLSPLNYKVQTTISVDGGPYTNFGNPWWRKDVPGVTNPQ